MTEMTREQVIELLEWRYVAGCDCRECQVSRAAIARLKADGEKIERKREALTQAEACMSIVAPRSDKAEYLRILGVVRAALKE